MRCLTVRHPWAWAIMAGLKAVENRSRPTRHRGDLAIHAGKSLAEFAAGADFEALMPGLPPAGGLPFGAVVCVVRVVDCVRFAEVEGRAFAEPIGWCWILEDPRPIGPIPWPGRLGMFEVPDPIIREALAVPSSQERSPMGLSWYNGFSPELREASFAWLKRELASGRVPPPSACQACGETEGHLDYHTEDYSRPFGSHIHEYQWCFRCHMALHARFRKPAMWARYIDQLEKGAIYRPLMSRREIGQVWVPGWVDRPLAMGPPRPRQEFFWSLAMEKAAPRPEAAQEPAGGVQQSLF